MFFDFIIEPGSLTSLDILIKIHNLLLLYFFYDISKWLIAVLSSRLGGRRRKF